MARLPNFLIATSVVLGGLLVAASEALAELRVGAHVRATVTEITPKSTRTKQHRGTLLTLTDTTMTIKPMTTKAPPEVRLRDVQRLEMRLQESLKPAGALVGLAIGVVVGGAIGWVAGDPNESDDSWVDLHPPPKTTAAAGAVVLGVTGLILGTIVAPGEKWVDVSPKHSALKAITLLPAGGRVVVNVSF